MTTHQLNEKTNKKNQRWMLWLQTARVALPKEHCKEEIERKLACTTT